MAATPIQWMFAPVKRIAPRWLSETIRSCGTACLTPIYFSARSGHFRSSLLVPLACELLAEGGVFICDNAEGYGFHDALKGRWLKRVDFYGHAPGVLLPHSTSIVRRGGSRVLEYEVAPIRVEYGW